MHKVTQGSTLFGMAAEFDSVQDILWAAKEARAAGFTRMDAYTPFPIHGLDDAIGFRDSRVKWIIFFSGLFGGCFGLWLQWWVSTQAYPVNVGGKPFFSWPAFVPVTFECTILLASFGAFFGMLALNGLPKPYHPIFNAKNFELASQNRFFLCIEGDDPKFDVSETRSFLESLEPLTISEVEA